jgi:hypothetical protein
MVITPPGSERQVGRVISVNNYRITVLLDPEIRSQVRAYSQRTAIITQIGSYLTFPVSPGESAVGILVGASEDEVIEPDVDAGMTLQLTRSRRIVRINLLGQLLENKHFVTGVSLYPTLETPAFLPTEEELKSILEYSPSPEKSKEDIPLSVGISPIYARQEVTVSYNDILGRPLGIIGNTGSGKSYSVASLLQTAMEAAQKKAQLAKFIILDINGEYCTAFCELKELKKDLNRAYIENHPFNLPLWMFNLSESIAFFEASQSSQVPVLERVITSVREDAVDPGPAKLLRRIVRTIENCLECLGSLSTYAAESEGRAVGKNTAQVLSHLEQHNKSFLELVKSASEISVDIPNQIKDLGTYANNIRQKGLKSEKDYDKDKTYEDFNRLKPETKEEIDKLIEDIEPCYQTVKQDVITKGNLRQVTADSPIKYDLKNLERDALFHIAVSRYRGQERIQEYIATLRLRIHRQLSDKRWSVFTETTDLDFRSLISKIIGPEGSNVTVVDCSMLAYDVLPFFCAVFGRVLLELRAHSLPDKRTLQPFVLILEEAHNYLRPRRDDESHGLQLSRETFERIAKEGRKFGLSLIIASQRPSDVSATVLSQCANFIVHRIQNPDDIDFFKKILPTASRDLLDQLPILAPGDGLLVGSAVNVPARVKVRKPSPAPTSETPKPWQSWQKSEPKFNVDEAIEVWTQETIPKNSKKT